jgi:hypothetical protein
MSISLWSELVNRCRAIDKNISSRIELHFDDGQLIIYESGEKIYDSASDSNYIGIRDLVDSMVLSGLCGIIITSGVIAFYSCRTAYYRYRNHIRHFLRNQFDHPVPDIVDAEPIARPSATVLNEIRFMYSNVFMREVFQTKSCPICMENFLNEHNRSDVNRPMVLRCGHMFCFSCLDTLLKTPSGDKCPTCRENMIGLPDEPNLTWEEELVRPYINLLYRFRYIRDLYPTVITQRILSDFDIAIRRVDVFQMRYISDTILDQITCGNEVHEPYQTAVPPRAPLARRRVTTILSAFAVAVLLISSLSRKYQ